ncbi:FAD:protein FMN transferase [Solimonas sp. K1W22B-7]|uniref:FAD:protein FMN transferase n=1 Tax=Solimonas sp. K1W22B-7 TaxID=2303331 RepID=UPI000E3366F3|nr:FAD:protein FMN transferase [Solimonas sp. K1W22B-7]AXQ29727.1 FAD:protein FMN transferase [Solimonas sp. K1W22B-7]
MNRVLVPHGLNPSSLPAHPDGGSLHAMKGRTMGTTWSVCVIAPAADLNWLGAGVQQELDRVVAQMSHWEPDSDLCRYNAAAAGTWHRLPGEFMEVLEASLEYALASDGAFDPSIGPLVDAWGFGPLQSRDAPPGPHEIEAARARVGWRRLQRDEGGQKLLQPGGLQLDFSSIAKGYAVDQVARYLGRAGVDHWLVEVGGELRGQGCKPDGQPWWVELERVGEELPRTVLALHGLSVATSGDYRRYFEWHGHRYAHTLDPRSGWPVTHALASVTVLHPECMQADALATVLGVLSPDEAYEFAEQRNFAAQFVLRTAQGFEERLTPAFEALASD